MKFPSCTHSLALLALSVITFQSSFALSVDSKAAEALQPRLDGGAISRRDSPSSGTARRRKKCKFSPTNSGAAAAAAATTNTHGTATASGFGYPAYNASTLANQLPYARSSTAIYLPSQQSGSLAASSSIPASNDSGDSGSPAAGNGSPVSAGSVDSPGACAQQVTVTVTSQTTVTVTQGAQEAASAGSNAAVSGGPDDAPAASGPAQGGQVATSIGGLNDLGVVSAPSQGAQAAATSSSNNGGGNAPLSNVDQGAQAATSAGFNAVLPSLAASSTGRKRTKCSKSTGTIFASASAGVFPPIGSGPYSGLVPSGSISSSGIVPSGVVPVPSGTGLAAPPSEYTSPVVSSNTTAKRTSAAALNGEFWAGATLGTLIRMQAIPGRVFYDYDGTTVKDPFKTLGDAGVNAVRVEGQRGQCLGPTQFVNNGSTLGEELLFQLDWGCLDTQVQAAQRGVAQGMRVIFTINQGFDIPAGMESYSYEQMVGEVQAEAKRQLQPLLAVGIVPDVILFENEGSDGFLFNDTTTGHARGASDGHQANTATLDKERCGIIPTGNMASYPQYTGYLKAEVMACNEAITAAGYPLDAVRYGLHSHGQFVRWKEAVFHGPNPGNQTYLTDSSGKECASNPIPLNLLSQNVSQMLTIMGFSAYPDPMTPVDINSPASQAATLTRLTDTLTQLQGYAESYGKYTVGPFTGQYKLQSLGVEYATAFTYEQVPQEQQLTAMMWTEVKKFSNLLGLLWYEPWYCHSDWEGGQGTLCHNVGPKDQSGEAPKNSLKTWGAAAVSPWKK